MIKKKIINFIKQNRVSSTEASDALFKKGSLEKIRPIDYQTSYHKVGNIKCVFACNESNYLVHQGVKKVKKGDIVIIFTKNCKNKSIIGDLIAKYTLLYKQAEAIVVVGNVRDLPKLIKEKYAIWCQGFNPVGCDNQNKGDYPKKEKNEILNRYENGIAICDLTGIVVIERKNINKKILDRLKFVEKQEDTWYHYLDVKKWDTKKIIVDKKYKK